MCSLGVGWCAPCSGMRAGPGVHLSPHHPGPGCGTWVKFWSPCSLLSFAIFCHPFPDGSVGKESACNAGGTGDAGLIPGLGRLLRGGKWQPTPVFLPEKSHGPRSWAGYKSKELQRVGHDWAIKLSCLIVTGKVVSITVKIGSRASKVGASCVRAFGDSWRRELEGLFLVWGHSWGEGEERKASWIPDGCWGVIAVRPVHHF